MFTGIIEALGTVRRLDADGHGCHLVVAEPTLVPSLVVGASAAVNGVCLTVVERAADVCRFQVGPETLSRTNLGDLAPGHRVNLERALRLGERLDGHLVQGHVDGVGRVAERISQGDWDLVWFECPPDLTPLMVPKGSIAVDGVSLTLVEVADDRFSAALIPHTLVKTTLGFKQCREKVNLETDLFAKYVQKYLERLDLNSLRH